MNSKKFGVKIMRKGHVLALITISLGVIFELQILAILILSVIGENISDGLFRYGIFPTSAVILCVTFILFLIDRDYFWWRKFKETIYPNASRYEKYLWKGFHVLSRVVFLMTLFYLPITMMLSR